MNAVILLCMYAKGRHKPVRNLHNLAKAVEKGDTRGVQKFYDRLSQEVSITLRKYPDIAGTLETMSQLTDEDMAQIDRVMIGSEPTDDEHAAAATFRAYWPQFDVEAVYGTITDLFAEINEGRGAELLYYPQWVVRRFVSDQVAWEAARFDPQVRADVAAAVGGQMDFFKEAPDKDARLAAVMGRHHLDGLVEVIVSSLSAGEPANEA